MEISVTKCLFPCLICETKLPLTSKQGFLDSVTVTYLFSCNRLPEIFKQRISPTSLMAAMAYQRNNHYKLRFALLTLSYPKALP